MTLISDLENQTIEQLIILAEQYPFAGVIYMVLAKKAKLENHEKAELFLRKAAIRVPSRKVLKNYLQVEKILETELVTIEDSVDSFLEDYDQFDEANSKTENTVNLEEKGDQVIIDNAEQLAENNMKVIAGDQLVVDQKEEAKERVRHANQRMEFTGFDDDHVHTIGDQLVQEHQEQEIDDRHLEGTNKSDLDPADELHLVDDIDRPELDEVDYDDVHEIGEALVIGEQKVAPASYDQIESKDEFDDLTVEDLRSDENDHHESVYKRVVEILKSDPHHEKVNDEPNHILEDVHRPEEVDGDYEDLENDEDSKKKDVDIDLYEKEIDVYDQELENLYAQAAYQANLEQELAEVETEDENDSEQIENIESVTEVVEKEAETKQLQNKGKTDFLGWLSRLSGTNTLTVSEEKMNFQSEEIPKPKEDEFLSEKEYREISTREVQEMAKKSMSTDQSIYTETLAYVYELQDKWQKAIEVYQVLSLKYPQKSAYFADKIEQLKEKLK